MSMKTMYWVSQIYSWNYIDIGGKTHGRIDWFEDIRDIGYWWQTAHETGMSHAIDLAKRCVEEAVVRRRMVLEARYLGSMMLDEGAPSSTIADSLAAADRSAAAADALDRSAAAADAPAAAVDPSVAVTDAPPAAVDASAAADAPAAGDAAWTA